MLSFYLDEAGNDADSYMTFAGLITTDEAWAEFETDARSWFDQIGLSHLHTKDFHQRKGFWRNKSAADRALFANGFFEILRRYALFGSTFSVHRSQYLLRKKELGRNKTISPLGFCMIGITNEVLKHEEVRSVLDKREHQLAYVIEAGHKNSEDVLARWKHMKQSSPFVGPISFVDKRDKIGLQAADFLAYFTRRFLHKAPTDKNFAWEFEFFKTATEGISVHDFVAEDFGI